MAKKKPSLEQRVKNFIQEQALVSREDCLLVAVSGGPDSTCLLNILVRLKDELGIRLHVAHLDHQLRGAESHADAKYVAEMTKCLGLPATIKRRDVKAYQAEWHLSLEEAAREVRYRFLADTASAVAASQVATGHTIDDHVETILMHLVRGTGTKGLGGIKPCTVWQLPSGAKRLTVVRPLLELYRQETDEYCQSHQLMPRIDASNLSLSPLRNRIRQQLLPLLKSYNPRVVEALLRTAAIAADELAFLDEETARLWGEVSQRQGSVIILDKESFGRLHPALKRHLLRTSILQLLGSLKDIETRHIEEMMAALNKPAGKQISLPEGIIFSIEYDRYLLGPDPTVLSPFPILENEVALKIPGEMKLPGWRVEATIIDLKGEFERGEASSETITPFSFIRGSVKGLCPFTNNSSPSPWKEGGIKGVGLIDKSLTAYFDFDKTGDNIIVRPRKSGDRFQPLGLSQPKKLGEFMIDTKIPRAWRERVPVVSSPEHILWLVGWRIDERVKVTEDTKRVLYLQAVRIVE
jgi:tRNA(Ile)-lysidine synthase